MRNGVNRQRLTGLKPLVPAVGLEHHFKASGSVLRAPLIGTIAR